MESLPEIDLNTVKASAKTAAKETTARLKSTGTFIAKTAERTKIVTVVIPQAYADLGKAVFRDGSRRKQFVDLFTSTDALLAQRDQLANDAKSRPAAKSLAEKAKKAAADAAVAARIKALDLRIYHAYAKLGEGVYKQQGSNSGPAEMVAAVANALAQRDRLDSETAAIESSARGRWLTPKRIVWSVCIVVGIGIVGSIVDPPKNNERKSGGSTGRSSLSSKYGSLIRQSNGLQIVQSLGELDDVDCERYSEMATGFERDGQTFVGTTSENMLLLLMVPSAKWKAVAKKKGLSRQEYFFATNLIFMGLGDGYNPQDRAMHDARLVKMTGERLADY